MKHKRKININLKIAKSCKIPVKISSREDYLSKKGPKEVFVKFINAVLLII